MTHDTWRTQPVGVLVSGGADSAILTADLANDSPAVYPLYVRFGLIWEAEEEAALRRFLAKLTFPALKPLTVFQCPIREVYGEHWSTSGERTPDAETPDEAVYLPGRNLLLTSQAAIWCHLHGVPTLAWGTLRGNPFADAGDPFFESLEKTVHLALGGDLKLVRPFSGMNKTQVLLKGQHLPLEETMSCIRPTPEGMHCGACNKCAERRKGFRDAGIPDRTQYAREGDTNLRSPGAPDFPQTEGINS
ncbi:MAG: 7-cyano-7-deazaguanine synthase [Planctomycetales bacterium]